MSLDPSSVHFQVGGSEAGDPSLHGAVGELVVEGGGGTRAWIGARG